MSTSLIIGKDINGFVCDTIHVSSDIVRAMMGANVAIEVVVPENVDRAFFAYGSAGDVWVDIQNTATLPSAGFSSTTTELNPVSRFVNPGDTISCICSVINTIQISFYNGRNY
ncbi:MAG: hypothetical protein ACTHME_05035 [Candidatus Nitrosocosmicus sp.]